RSLLRPSSGKDALEAYYRDFKERYGQRPTASELFHEGYAPLSLRTSYGSWFLFVKAMGDLSEPQQDALARTTGFLSALETTKMTKSFKMLTLLAMLNEDAFPGSVAIKRLADAFVRLADRSAVLREEVGTALSNPSDLIRLLEENPIRAWVEGRGTG